MIYYLNTGLIVEQALRDIIATYIDRLQLDRVYSNYHISVINEHPFAHMIVDDNARASDSFPCIIITSNSDQKVPEMINVPPQTTAIGLTSENLDELIAQSKRIKTKINNKGEVVKVKKNGEYQYEKLEPTGFTYENGKFLKTITLSL